MLIFRLRDTSSMVTNVLCSAPENSITASTIIPGCLVSQVPRTDPGAVPGRHRDGRAGTTRVVLCTLGPFKAGASILTISSNKRIVRPATFRTLEVNRTQLSIVWSATVQY